MKNYNTFKVNNKYDFREIEAKDEIFIEAKAKNKDFLEGFKVFLELQTIKSGKAQGGKSGKSISYMNYLVRLFIFANQNKDIKIDETEFFNELKLIQKTSDFEDYNILENRFPNATINSYFEFWLMKAFEEDDYLDNSMVESDAVGEDLLLPENIIPRKKPEKTEKGSKVQYVRDLSVIEYVKAKSEWSCEFHSSHSTFISKVNDFPYVEAHHLIPMSLQDNFHYSLDIPSNVISLCPNCHRMVHHGIDKNKEEILQYFYLKRKNELDLAGITISYSDLLFLYGINN